MVSKQFVKTAAVGLAWFVGFTIVTNLVVRPVVRKIAATANTPKLANLI